MDVPFLKSLEDEAALTECPWYSEVSTPAAPKKLLSQPLIVSLETALWSPTCDRSNLDLLPSLKSSVLLRYTSRQSTGQTVFSANAVKVPIS